MKTKDDQGQNNRDSTFSKETSKVMIGNSLFEDDPIFASEGGMPNTSFLTDGDSEFYNVYLKLRAQYKALKRQINPKIETSATEKCSLTKEQIYNPEV